MADDHRGGHPFPELLHERQPVVDPEDPETIFWVRAVEEEAGRGRMPIEPADHFALSLDVLRAGVELVVGERGPAVRQEKDEPRVRETCHVRTWRGLLPEPADELRQEDRLLIEEAESGPFEGNRRPWRGPVVDGPLDELGRGEPENERRGPA